MIKNLAFRFHVQNFIPKKKKCMCLTDLGKCIWTNLFSKNLDKIDLEEPNTFNLGYSDVDKSLINVSRQVSKRINE